MKTLYIPEIGDELIINSQHQYLFAVDENGEHIKSDFCTVKNLHAIVIDTWYDYETGTHFKCEIPSCPKGFNRVTMSEFDEFDIIPKEKTRKYHHESTEIEDDDEYDDEYPYIDE